MGEPQATSHFRSGLAHLHARRFLRARRQLARAVQEGGPDAAWAAQELVHTYLRRGEAARAESDLQRSVEPGSPLQDYAIGYLLRRLGRRRDALARLTRAASADPPAWAATNELGYLLCLDGQLAQGLRCLADAESHFAACSLWGQAMSVFYRATVALTRFQLREALALYQQVVAMRSACGDRSGVAAALMNTGVAHYYLADFHAAIGAYERALSILEEVGDLALRGRIHSDIGSCHTELANLARASAEFRRARGLFRRVGDRASEAGARANLGFVCRMRRDYRGAERHYRAALSQLGEEHGDEHRPQVMANLAQVLNARARPGQALRLLASAAAAGRVNTRTGILLARETAHAELALGRYGRAIVAARRVLSLARTIPGPQRTLVTSWVPAEIILGRAQFAQGHYREALRALRRGARRVEQLLARQPGASLRIGLLETKRAAHDAWLQCVVALGGPRCGRRGWQIAARLKARELRQTIAAGGLRPEPPGPRDEVEAEIRQLTASPKLAPGQVKRLRTLRRQYLDELDREVSVTRGGTDDGDPDALVRSLDPATAVLEYHVAPETTHCFVACRRRVVAVDVGVPEATLERMVERLLRPLRDAGQAGDARPYLDAFDLRAASRLDTRVFGPVRSLLPGHVRRLVIVPDGPLHALPFELLVCARSGIDGRADDVSRAAYLGDRYTVSYALSSLLLRDCGRRRPPRNALALAYSPDAGAVVQGSAGPLQLAALDAAGREARAVAQLFARGRIFAGREATAGAYLGHAPRADLIHIAAHALSDPYAPGLSGVVLSPPNGVQRPDLLTGERITRCPLRAELVTLSACATGAGRQRRSEGVLGLSRAFLEAGASAVLGSLWSVDDRATLELMQGFYRRLVGGDEPAVALAAGKRRLRAMGRSHPFFWAPFVLLDHRPSIARDERAGDLRHWQ